MFKYMELLMVSLTYFSPNIMKVVEIIGQTAHIWSRTNAHIISVRTLEGRDCF